MRAAPPLLATLAVLLSVVACATYGEEANESPADAGGANEPDARARSDADTTPAPKDDASAPADAGPDAPTFAESCPPCTAGKTCIAAGCSAEGTVYNACNKPLDVLGDLDAVAFVCPEGDTATIPPPAPIQGEVHVATFRLASGSWTIKASGANPFIGVGDCSSVGAGSGDTSSVTRSSNGGLVVIGTTNKPLSTCSPITIELNKN